jgi:aminoglycoside phosphotransferase (APT) family kinase protein
MTSGARPADRSAARPSPPVLPARADFVKPARAVDVDLATRLVARALPQRRVTGIAALEGGILNSLFRLRLDDGRQVVLRIHEREPSACEREVELLELVRGTVPVPQVIGFERDGFEGLPPLSLLTFVEGVSGRVLKERGDPEAVGQAAYAIGRTLAAIATHQLPGDDVLGPRRIALDPRRDGGSLPHFIEDCLATPAARRRIGDRLADATTALAWSFAHRLAALRPERRLVHGDFHLNNILVRRAPDGWEVAAVLDWEFAAPGSPLVDVGHFLRRERRHRPLREPHFSRGFFEGGGTLPDDWRALARVVDLADQCETLARDALPDPVAADLRGLVEATVEGRDPP